MSLNSGAANGVRRRARGVSLKKRANDEHWPSHMNIRRSSACVRTLCFLSLLTCLFFVGRNEFFAADDASAASEAKSSAKTQDLGQGLVYFRVTNLTEQLADIRSVIAKNPALVLDLRGVNADIAAARVLRSALMPTSDTTKVARFVLVNGSTATTVIFALGGGLPDNSVPGVVVVAPESSVLVADVKVPCTADEDKRACEAIANGTPLGKLIDFQPEKQRYDEAVLVREHAGQPAPEAEAAAADADAARPDAAVATDAQKEKPAQARPLTDSVLLAAVQVHRALLALKKI